MGTSTQMIAWKAFEYALLITFEERLSEKTHVNIIKNSSFDNAQHCFRNIDKATKSEYLLASSFAVNFLIDTEPRLSHDINEDDILQLEILSDDHGKQWDVRDIIAIRVLQKREIGVSAKHNHSAVKHSRLSMNIDFWEKRIGEKVSQHYINAITPIFQRLQHIKEQDPTTTRKSLGNYQEQFYVPILNAFKDEIWRLYQKNPEKVASQLVSYLLWIKDFYKIIKRKSTIEIHAYNIHGTLNLPFQNIKPKFSTPQITLPTEITNIYWKENTNTTLIMECNNDREISFRIHNASSRVEPSLKFDIQLNKSPKSLYKNTLHIRHKAWK